MKLERSIVSFVLAGTLTLGFVGCVPSHEAGQRDIFDQSRISQIQKGTTTKDNIIVLFGQPAGTQFAANGDETWSYYYTLTTGTPFVPGSGKTSFTELIVTFDNRSIVKSYGTQNASS